MTTQFRAAGERWCPIRAGARSSIGCTRPFLRTIGTGRIPMTIDSGKVLVSTMAFAAVAVLTSCAAHRPFVEATPCAGPECTIDVTVVAIGSSCQASPIPDIDARAAGEHKITWRMTTPNYEFSAEPYKIGIYIKDDPDDDFSNAVVPGNGRTATIMFKHRNPGKNYRYGVNVRRSNVEGKPFCEPLDPWLIS
jgi:hypothetical protein